MTARYASFLIFILLSGCGVVDHLGGASSKLPADIDKLSSDARALVERSLSDIDPDKMIDYHVHMLGTGTSGSGIYLGPPLTSSLQGKAMAALYSSGGGIKNDGNGDEEYVARLRELLKHSPLSGPSHILAYDETYHTDGRLFRDETMFYIPNQYVYDLSQRYPEEFVPVISINPLRSDALDELSHWAALGVRYLKWSAPRMEFSPGNKRFTAFYQLMADHGMVLLTHGGPYSAARSAAQGFGNPLHLRLPLSLGVKVIIAHSASSGMCEDFDATSQPKLVVPCFDLFMRLLGNSAFEELLFGDISAILNSSHLGNPLKELLAHPELHSRLLYGSDYPGPAINIVISTSDIAEQGFISEAEAKALNEIYDYNPLLFDYVLQRTVQHPETGARFSAAIFQQNPRLP